MWSPAPPSPIKQSSEAKPPSVFRNLGIPHPSSLQTLFQMISLQHVFILLRVLLLERSVLFLSSQYSLLTTVMESLKELLYG